MWLCPPWYCTKMFDWSLQARVLSKWKILSNNKYSASFFFFLIVFSRAAARVSPQVVFSCLKCVPSRLTSLFLFWNFMLGIEETLWGLREVLRAQLNGKQLSLACSRNLHTRSPKHSIRHTDKGSLVRSVSTPADWRHARCSRSSYTRTSSGATTWRNLSDDNKLIQIMSSQHPARVVLSKQAQHFF